MATVRNGTALVLTVCLRVCLPLPVQGVEDCIAREMAKDGPAALLPEIDFESSLEKPPAEWEGRGDVVEKDEVVESDELLVNLREEDSSFGLQVPSLGIRVGEDSALDMNVQYMNPKP